MTSGASSVDARIAGSRPKITVAGTVLADDVSRSMLSTEIETTTGRPDLCEIRFQQRMDGSGTPGDDLSPDWMPGKELKVEWGGEEVFKGEITSVDFVGGTGSTTQVVLLAFDKRHRMYRKELVKVFKDASLKDVVAGLLGDTGITHDLSGLPTTVMKYYLHEGTPGDLIEQICDQYGLYCLWREDKVAVKKSSELSEVAGTIKASAEMLDYRLRQTTSADRAKAEVRGWDPKTKDPIVGAGTRSAALPAGGLVESKDSASDFTEQTLFHTTHVAAKAEADARSVGILARNVDAGMQLDATTSFLPKMTAGKLVEVEGVPKRFAGKYRLSSVRHRYDLEEGGRTYLVCRGADDPSLPGLLAQAVLGGASGTARLGHGLQPAIVANVKSVTGEGALGADGAAGEVKVKLPWLGDNIESGWLRVLTVGGGTDRGFFVMPEKDDEVLVAFHDGDMRSGYVLGGLYNGMDPAPRKGAKLTDDGEKVHERVWRSRTGHELVLGDKKGEEYVQLILGDAKTRIRMDKKNTKLTIETTNITILPDGKIEILSDGEITMKAKTDFKLEAANISLKAQQNVTIEGGMKVSINGTSGAELKGTKVDITAQGPATVKGNPIMLN